MASILSAPHFHDEAAAYAKLESIVWPNGPVCPHCGETARVGELKGKTTRPGLRKCYACRKQFRATVGTVFESSHIAVHLWLQAAYLMCSSKKGISSHQLARTLDITVKSAWFMSHRLREAMRDGSLAPMGGSDGVHGIVEADETFIGREPGVPVRRAYHHKMKVLSLLDREAGQVRSTVVDDLKAETIVPILKENIAKEKGIRKAAKELGMAPKSARLAVAAESLPDEVKAATEEAGLGTVKRAKIASEPSPAAQLRRAKDHTHLPAAGCAEFQPDQAPRQAAPRRSSSSSSGASEPVGTCV